MLVSFHIWKIVLGLVISAALIVFAVTYIGSYMEQQNDLLRARILNNFEIGSYEVYSSGNSLEFDDFSKVSFDLRFSMSGDPGITLPSLGKKTLRVPVFLSYGDDMIISRGETNLGWWRFRYVVAMEESEIVVSMDTNSAESWKVLTQLVGALPDTTNFDNKVTYALCNGNNIERNFCGRDGKSQCDGGLFLEELEAGTAPVRFSKCNADIRKEQRLVTISSSCQGVTEGVCIVPGEFSGDVFISEKQFAYADQLDIAVIVVGYTRKDVYGMWGENFYKYKNLEMAKELKLASEIVSKRSQLLSNEISSLVSSQQLDSDADEAACVELFNRLGVSAQAMQMALESDNLEGTTRIIQESAAIKQDLVDKGCDYD